MASTTTTTTPTAPSAPKLADRRPLDSMKSTWRTGDKKEWGLHHWMLHLLNVHPSELDKPIPTFKKTDPVPVWPNPITHVWIIYHALWPMLIQLAWQKYTGKAWHPMSVFAFYAICMNANSIHQIWVMRRLGHIYGFFDGDKHARDGVPDVGVVKTVHSLLSTTTFRPMIATIMAYRRSAGTDLQLSWWLPVELSIYGIVLDIFFYAYHRACHEIDFLWQIHRRHHLTKHPNVLLSSYADTEQEFLEIMLIPFLTWLTMKYVLRLPMPFHDWWICHEYVIFNEAIGHSGLRTYGSSPTPIAALLHWFGVELQLEDHDLHHRNGWRKSSNYGKHCRVWDKLFGTARERIETKETNVDWDRKVAFPLY